MTCDLTRFDIAEMLRCGRAILQASATASTMERAAQQICLALYDELRDADGETRACALVRCYKTHPFGGLDSELQAFARRTVGDVQPHDSLQCLVLLGTAGEVPSWNSRRLSSEHQAIALPSEEMVERTPMIAQLFTELGVPIEHVIAPSPEIVRNLAGKSYGVFHVENALGSPFVPAQRDFVVPYAVRSVVGFGGMLATGDQFAVIFFSRVPVSTQVAGRFRRLAIDLKAAVYRFGESRVFDEPVTA